jgi:hypothetical protein
MPRRGPCVLVAPVAPGATIATIAAIAVVSAVAALAACHRDRAPSARPVTLAAAGADAAPASAPPAPAADAEADAGAGSRAPDLGGPATAATTHEVTDPGTATADITASRTAFARAAASHDNTYRYVRAERSWTGAGSDTTIEVTRGIVTARSFLAFRDGADRPLTSWTEHGAEVGHHADDGAAPPSTMDALYDDCLHTLVVLRMPDQFAMFLTFDPQGLLASCVRTAKQCADDCTEGITLSSIAFGPPPGK